MTARLNACHSRKPYRATTIVQDGWTPPMGSLYGGARHPKVVGVPFRMAQDCQYTKSDLGQADKGCIGCPWREER